METKLFFGSISFILAAITTAITVPYIIKFGKKYNLVDEPDERKHHRKSVVRIGGVAILFGLIIAMIFVCSLLRMFTDLDLSLDRPVITALIICLIFFLIGLVDDLFSLSPFLRLGIQFLITLFAWSQGLGIQLLDISPLGLNISEIFLPNFLSILLTCIWLVGVSNSINWMDGMDGLASGVCLIKTIGIVLISFSFDNSMIFFIAFSLAGSSLGFLIHNFYPSKIYMGDSGSYLYGSCIAILSILTFTKYGGVSSHGLISIEKSLLFVLIPISDMTFVILKRLWKRKSPFFPDRSHLHHRILNYGKNVPETLLIIYGLVFGTTLLTFILY